MTAPKQPSPSDEETWEIAQRGFRKGDSATARRELYEAWREAGRAEKEAELSDAPQYAYCTTEDGRKQIHGKHTSSVAGFTVCSWCGRIV